MTMVALGDDAALSMSALAMAVLAMNAMAMNAMAMDMMPDGGDDVVRL